MPNHKVRKSIKKTIVSYSLEKRLIEDITELAIERKVTASKLVNEALKEFVNG